MSLSSLAPLLIVCICSAAALPLSDPVPSPESPPTQPSIRPARRLPPPSDTDSITVEDLDELEQIARDTKRVSLEASQYALTLMQYLIEQGVNTTDTSDISLCFIEERDVRETQHGHLSPDTDYVQRLVEDYYSVQDGYQNYMDHIQEEFIDTQTNTSDHYMVHFNDFKNFLAVLKDQLKQLIQFVDSEALSDLKEEGSGIEILPESCHDVSYRQQYWVYLEFSTLFSTRYVINDIAGLKDTVKEN